MAVPECGQLNGKRQGQKSPEVMSQAWNGVQKPVNCSWIAANGAIVKLQSYHPYGPIACRTSLAPVPEVTHAGGTTGEKTATDGRYRALLDASSKIADHPP